MFVSPNRNSLTSARNLNKTDEYVASWQKNLDTWIWGSLTALHDFAKISLLIRTYGQMEKMRSIRKKTLSNQRLFLRQRSTFCYHGLFYFPFRPLI